MNIILFEFLLYCVVISIIGFTLSKKVRNQEDFLLGGKKLPGWALAFSERATGESAWLLLGYTGFVFTTGLAGIWVAIGIAVGIIFSWLFLAKRFMREQEKYKVLTVPDYLAIRFGDKAKIIRWLAGLLISGMMIFYIGAQMAGAGKLLFTTFELTFYFRCDPCHVRHYFYRFCRRFYLCRLDGYDSKYYDVNYT